MKSIIFLALLVSCTTPAPKPVEPPAEEAEDLTQKVSLDVALEHIGQSYTLGCVQALKKLGGVNVYPACRKLGIQHQEAVRKMLSSP